MVYNLEQLERLAANPHFHMSPELQQQLEAYRNGDYKKVKKSATKKGVYGADGLNESGPVKHSTTFKKHNPELEEEKTDGGETTNRN